MTYETIKKAAGGAVWGLLGKITNAGVNLISLPLMINYFGKKQFGLISLAFSVNIFLQILNLGLPTGAVKFIAGYRTLERKDKIIRALQSNTVLFSILGVLFGFTAIIIGHYSKDLYRLDYYSYEEFNWCMITLAITGFINWYTNSMICLVNAYECVGFSERINLFSNIFRFFAAVLTIEFKLSLVCYFLLYSISGITFIPLILYKVMRLGYNPLSIIIPKFYYQDFKPILLYSITLFIIGIFQYLGNQLRPLILGYVSNSGVVSVADYQILQTIGNFILFFGSVFLNPLIPAFAKQNTTNSSQLNDYVVNGTKALFIFISLIILLFIVNAKQILLLYVGPKYSHLTIWLQIMAFSLIGIHNQVVSAYIIAKSNIKPLIFIIIIAAIISVVLQISLGQVYDVGGAVLSFLVYKILELSMTYFYYLPRYTSINISKFYHKGIKKPLLIFILTAVVMFCFNNIIKINNNITSIAINTFIVFLVFATLTYKFVLTKNELLSFKLKAMRIINT